jgi:uncharacterized protein
MILRFLAFIGVMVLVARVTRMWLSALQPKPPIDGGDRDLSKIDDVMIKDPYCNVYFPKRDGVQLRFRGEDLYFCSDACRDNFLAERK